MHQDAEMIGVKTGLKVIAVVSVASLLAVACSDGDGGATTDTSADVAPSETAAESSTEEVSPAGTSQDEEPSAPSSLPAPPVPSGPLAQSVIDDLDLVFANLRTGFDFSAVERLGRSGDPRVAWLLADLLRFLQQGETAEVLTSAFETLTGTEVVDSFAWGAVTNRLISWDTPAPPGYVQWKRKPFEIIEPAWQPFFEDPDSTIDYRYLTWGGVLIDNRPISTIHQACERGCIAAMTEPPFTDVDGAGWLAEDTIVFGVVVGDEARAYPKNQMEVHEMVNDLLGGRRIAIPYCTLCGSAQAYFTDEVDVVASTELGVEAGRYEMRTSGLLSRSNKVMFELQTMSAFDTFTGEAVSGPLRALGVVLPEITVETAVWGDWRARHPGTSVLSQTGVLGTPYPDEPLRGRDADGPIFPIGDVDDRLGVQTPVVGVVLADGTAVAFDVEAATRAIDAGQPVELAGVRLVRDGGLRAELDDGTALVSHQAFWFAWSQFHDTLLWTAP